MAMVKTTKELVLKLIDKFNVSQIALRIGVTEKTVRLILREYVKEGVNKQDQIFRAYECRMRPKRIARLVNTRLNYVLMCGSMYKKAKEKALNDTIIKNRERINKLKKEHAICKNCNDVFYNIDDIEAIKIYGVCKKCEGIADIDYTYFIKNFDNFERYLKRLKKLTVKGA